MRSAWFTLGFLDPATLYIILSNSAAHLDRLRGLKDGQKSVETDKYHLLALQSINGRMRQPEVDVTEALIGSATGFMCHNVRLGEFIVRLILSVLQDIVGDTEQWKVHVEGVTAMVEMRGGLDSIVSFHLRETISWYDAIGRPGFNTDIETILG